MQCLQCQYENLPDSVFCQECGTRLEWVCPHCQTANPLTSKFCRKCGTPFTEQMLAPNPVQPVPGRKSYASKWARLRSSSQC
ncbi:MAG: zinc ribbon domain-containing protein [Candidatus Tectomicrobia bacterium]|nr:zinc ribbon domain-containing protein [Candidatus Tectomicrobia bacterium]